MMHQLCGLPDIEDFAYKKTIGSPSSSRSTETSITVTSVKTAGYPPENWVEVLEGIRQMRSSEDAPVDSMGCDKAGSFLPPTERRFAVLLGALLSSQTKDQVNNGEFCAIKKHLFHFSSLHSNHLHLQVHDCTWILTIQTLSTCSGNTSSSSKRPSYSRSG
jgi:hypothetical protein